MIPRPAKVQDPSSDEEEEDLEMDNDSLVQGDDDEDEDEVDGDDANTDHDEDNEDSEDDEVFEEKSSIGGAGEKPLTMTSQMIDLILKAVPANDESAMANTIRKLKWDTCAKECQLPLDEFKTLLSKWTKTVLRKITLREILMLAQANTKRYLKKDKIVRATNVYQLVFKDIFSENAHISITERMKLVKPKYEALSAAEREMYEREALRINIEKGLYNADGSKKQKIPEKRSKSSNFLLTVTPNDPTEKKKTMKQTKLSIPGIKIESPKDDDDTESVTPHKGQKPPKDNETVPVNVFQFFMEERKSRGIEESKAEVQKAFAKLSPKEHLQFTYKILKTVEEKYNKRPVLTKVDQELLDKYENRPTNPGTAYTIFLNEKTSDPELANLKYIDKCKVIGPMWKQLDADAKQRYLDIYSKKKAIYDKDYQAFLDNLPEFRKEQETAVKPRAKRTPKRRASVGDDVEGLEQGTNSTFIGDAKKKESDAAKRRQRSKTIDCSTSMNISDFFKVKEKVPDKATPIKKATPVKLSTPIKKESPVKKPTKRKADEEVTTKEGDSEISPKKAKKTLKKNPDPVTSQEGKAEKITESTLSPKKVKKAAKKITESVSTTKVPEKVSNSEVPTKKAKKAAKKISEPSTPTEQIITNGFSQETNNSNGLETSPKKTKKKGKDTPKSPAPTQREVVPPTEVQAKESFVKSTAKNKQKKANEEKVEKEVPKTQSPEKKKQKKLKQKSVAQEPVKPPESVKAYFESIYTGDKSRAKKEFKKLPLAEKEKYHQELTQISNKYIEDLTAYMKTLSKEEVALFMARQNV